MANEIKVQTTADRTVYYIVRNSAGQVYSTVSSTFGTFSDVAMPDYDFPMTEQGTSSGYYVADFPPLAAGVYDIVAYIRLSGSPAVSDTAVAIGRIVWSGTAELTEKSTYDLANSASSSAATAASNASTAASNAAAAQTAAEGAESAAGEAQTAAESTLAAVDGIDEVTVQGVFDKAVDGIRFESAIELMMAVLGGRASVSVDAGSGSTTVSYRKRNGTTNKVTVVHDAIGNRTSSVINS